jgi:AraC family transcriptional regulator
VFKNGAINAEFSHEPSNPLRVIAVHFEPLGRPLRPCAMQLNQASFVVSLLERVQSAWDKSCEKEAEFWLSAVILELQNEQKRLPVASSASMEEVLKQMAKQITETVDYEWQVSELAASVSVSPDHFSRLFRATIGISPGEFIIEARLKAAKRLLLLSSHPVARIAELCGYNTPQFFCRQFRQRTGLTPARFRKADRQREGHG